MLLAPPTGTLVTPLAQTGTLHGVALTAISDHNLTKLETLVLQSVWGATRLFQAKEIVFSPS